MNLHVRKDSPLELPPGCKDAMEEQARQVFLEEEQEERLSRQPRHVGDSPRSGPSPEIPLPGKAVAGGSIPKELPY